MRSRNVHRKIKLKISKTIIRAILWYGCETWTFTKTSEKMLDKFERRILRRIFGPIKLEDGWKIRYNAELYELYDDLFISTQINFRKLWADTMGRTYKKNGGELDKIFLKDRMEGRRSVDKLRGRWVDFIYVDSHTLLQRSD